jgi:hypothetical protein
MTLIKAQATISHAQVGFTLPLVTGPVAAVTGLTGPAR